MDIEIMNITYEDLRALVTDTIKQYGHQFQFSNLCGTVAINAVKKSIVPHPYGPNSKSYFFTLQTPDENRVKEILYDLISEGFLRIGDYENSSWPHLSLIEED